MIQRPVERLWSYGTTQPNLSLRGTSAPALVADVALLAFDNGKLVIIQTTTGLIGWERQLAKPGYGNEFERLIDVDSSPLIIGQDVYVAGYQGVITALKVQDGAVQWREPISTTRKLAEAFGSLFVVENTGVIKALHVGTGRTVWRNDELEGLKPWFAGGCW